MSTSSEPSSRAGVITLVCWIVVIVGIVFFISHLKEKYKAKAEAETKAKAVAAKMAPPQNEFPSSGEGHATKDKPIKAWLDPKRTNTRPTRPAKYVFVEDTTLFFDDTAGIKVQVNRSWQEMPAGKYLVYPIKEVDNVYFRWW